MSAKLMGQIWGLVLTDPERLVLMALADHADDDGTNCYPGLEYLGWKLDKTERQIRRIISRLCNLGIVEIINHGQGRGVLSGFKIDLKKGTFKALFNQKKAVIQGQKEDIQNNKADIEENKRGNPAHEKGKSTVAKADIHGQNPVAIRKNHVNHIEPSEEPPTEAVDPASLKSGHREHPHFEVFRKAFQEFYGSPCPVAVAGFVQFAELLKLHDGNLEIAEWSKAVRHYFLSEVSNRTFADLCSKYAEYHKNPLDRYRKPILTGNGSGKPKRAAV